MTDIQHSNDEAKRSGGNLAGRLHVGAVLGLLVAMTGGPCEDRDPAPDLPTQPTAVSSGAAPAPAQPPEPATPRALAPASAERQQTPTPRQYMLTHYADTVGMRRALVAGKLVAFRTAAGAVASDEWTPRLRGDYRPYVDAVRARARSAATAPSSLDGAADLGKLGQECAACHVKFGGPGSPSAPEQLTAGADPGMIAHAVATDLLWRGIVLPSDRSWASGVETLLDAPKLDSDVDEVAAVAHRLRDLARQGKDANPAQRGQIFAAVLTTCADCHERLGIAPSP